MPVNPWFVMRHTIAMPSAIRRRGENRIDVRLDGIHVRRNEDASRVRGLLVDVVDDLRIPRRVQRVHRVARLELRERVPVAVVVVADVLVIELRRIAPFRRRAERGAIVVADDVDAIRIL